MKIRIGEDYLKITHNENNKFWKPLGLFWNITEIKIHDEWYRCGIKYINKESKYFIEISNPMKVDKETSRILLLYKDEGYSGGMYKKIKVSFFKMNLIKFLEHQHSLNYKWYGIRKIIWERKNTVFVMLLAFILSSIYYYFNITNENSLLKYISENTWIQTVIIFLTISSFINIFIPFTIRKEISKEDIEEISKGTIEEDKINKEIEKNASF